MKRKWFLLGFLLCLPLLSVAHFKLTSSAFKNGQRIPTRYVSCALSKRALNESPALSWSGAPAGTRSFAVIMSDLDIPITSMIVITGKDGKPYSPHRKIGYHWVLVDIPGNAQGLPVNINHNMPMGLTGINLFGRNDYTGPCPPMNDTIMHHYVITLYALNIGALALPVSGHFNAVQAMEAMQGHVLATARYTGYYKQ